MPLLKAQNYCMFSKFWGGRRPPLVTPLCIAATWRCRRSFCSACGAGFSVLPACHKWLMYLSLLNRASWRGRVLSFVRNPRLEHRFQRAWRQRVVVFVRSVQAQDFRIKLLERKLARLPSNAKQQERDCQATGKGWRRPGRGQLATGVVVRTAHVHERWRSQKTPRRRFLHPGCWGLDGWLDRKLLSVITICKQWKLKAQEMRRSFGSFFFSSRHCRVCHFASHSHHTCFCALLILSTFCMLRLQVSYFFF